MDLLKNYPEYSDNLSAGDILSFLGDVIQIVEGNNAFLDNDTGIMSRFSSQEYMDEMKNKLKDLLIELNPENGIKKYEMVGYSFFIYVANNKFDRFRIFANHTLFKEPKNRTYYFKIGKCANFPEEFRAGSGEIHSYSNLSADVKTSFRISLDMREKLNPDGKFPRSGYPKTDQ